MESSVMARQNAINEVWQDILNSLVDNVEETLDTVAGVTDNVTNIVK
jgi:hypothetical protein